MYRKLKNANSMPASAYNNRSALTPAQTE